MISLLFVMAENRVIGRDNALPWHLPADFRRFKKLTMGHPIVMGRKTWESLGRPLPGRRSIVVSRRPDYRLDGAEVVASLDEALAKTADDDEVFVIGGAELFTAALPRADRIYLTRVRAEVEGDVFLPAFEDGPWELVSEEEREADERHTYPLTFQVYERRR